MRDPALEWADDAGASGQSWGERLRSFRLDRLRISRKDFAELINSRARDDRVNVACSERHVARWEDGDVYTPSAPYRSLLITLGAPVPTPPRNPHAFDLPPTPSPRRQ